VLFNLYAVVSILLVHFVCNMIADLTSVSVSERHLILVKVVCQSTDKCVDVIDESRGFDRYANGNCLRVQYVLDVFFDNEGF